MTVALNEPFTLTYPIEHEGKTYTTFSFRELTMGDMVASEKINGGLAQTAFMLSRSADVPEAVILKMRATDLKRLENLVDRLLGNGSDDEAGES